MPHVRALTLLALVLTLPLFAQKEPPKKPADDAPGFDLPTDEKLASHLEVAKERFEKKDWPVVVTLLQKLLNREEDVFATISRTGPDGKDTKALVNLRFEAGRLLGKLPSEGRAWYRQEYEAAAAYQLKQARMFADATMYAEVMRRYPLTDAGIEATERLALHHLDRGNHFLAALAFGRLLERTSADQLAPLTLHRAAVAFRKGGEHTSQVESILKALETKIGKDGLDLGKKKHSFEELKKEIEKLKPAQPGRGEWRLFRGDERRNATADGGVPFLEPLWKVDTINEANTLKRFREVQKYLDSAKQPLMLSSHPIGLVLRAENNEIPLVFYRDFWGIRARVVKDIPAPKPEDALKVGELYWETPSTWSIERMMREPKYVGTLEKWLDTYIEDRFRPQVFLENSLYGSLSSDGARVYAVEDFQVPVPGAPLQFLPGDGKPVGSLGEALVHNRLQAIDADVGKLIWEIGCAGGKDPLADSFFLSSPLPLGGKLYILNEKGSQLRLLTLDPEKGELLDSTPLGKIRGEILLPSFRRAGAAQLAHAEGVLICPTQCGAVLGVERLTRQVKWAFNYERVETKTVAADGREQGIIRLADKRWLPPMGEVRHWRNSPPLITGKRVLVAPPDAVAIHCLDLYDGRLLWKQPRQINDMHVAGVIGDRVLIVGEKSCRALALADGKQVWELRTGMPSGLGVAVGGHYYLPLARGDTSDKPELAILDAGKGTIISRVRSRKDEQLGNLMFFHGQLISQSATTIAAYPLLADIQKKEVEEKLTKDPKDAQALATRGDLKLDRGDVKGASEDYRTALQQKPPAELRNWLRSRLYDAMIELLQRDFKSAEPHLKEIEDLSRVENNPTEEKRRRTTLLLLMGRAREQQGKRVEAARHYIELGNMVHEKLIEAPDDPGLKLLPSVYAQQRLDAILKAATPEEKKQIEQELADRLKKARSRKDPAELRGLVETVSVAHAVGREARLELAELLSGKGSFLDAEQLLLPVRVQKQDATAAARALDQLANLCTRVGLLADAVYFWKELARDHGNVTVRAGKTGKDLYEDLLNDKRMLPALGEPEHKPGQQLVRCKVTEVKGDFPAPALVQELIQSGEHLPFLAQHRLGIRPNYGEFTLLVAGKEPRQWSETLRFPTVRGLPVRYSHNLGHLMVLYVEGRTLALDPVNRRLLWDRNLHGDDNPPSYHSHVYNPADGSLKIVHDGWIQRIPRRIPLAQGIAILNTRTALLGVNPVDGRTLWEQKAPASDLDLFHDGEHLFVTELDEKGHATRSRVLEMRTGLAVNAADFAPLHQFRVKPHGRTLVLAEQQKEALVLRQFDVLSGKDRWKERFASGTLLLESNEENLAGVVQPDGKVSVFDLDASKGVLKAKMDSEHLKGAGAVALLRDANAFYLACRGPRPEKDSLTFPGVVEGTNLRSIPANGQMYCFENNGALRWFNKLEDQMLVVTHFQAMPALLFTARVIKGKPEFWFGHSRAIDKKTGKLLFDREERYGSVNFIHGITVDEKTGIAEILRQDWKLRLEPNP